MNKQLDFLRVPDAKNPFDATGIHPESYKAAEQVLEIAGLRKAQIGTKEAEEALKKISI